MKSDVLAFSRTSYCETCYRNGSPQKGDLACIYHTSEGLIKVHTLTKGNTRGFTPTLFMIDIPVPPANLVKMEKICGICGFSLSDKDEEGRRQYQIIDSKEIFVEKKDFIALWKKFKNSGYEV